MRDPYRHIDFEKLLNITNRQFTYGNFKQAENKGYEPARTDPPTNPDYWSKDEEDFLEQEKTKEELKKQKKDKKKEK